MADCSIGEIRAVAFNFAPVNWHICDGSLLPISQYDALYTLLGTTYGGDGVNTFGLPDLRGRVALNQGTGLGLTSRVLGQSGGTEGVTLLQTQIGAHTHNVMASTAAGSAQTPTNNVFAAPADTTTPSTEVKMYLPDAVTPKTLIALDASTVSPVGGSQAHENRMPYLPVTYIISLSGVWPSSN